jgi:hypothetical protein
LNSVNQSKGIHETSFDFDVTNVPEPATLALFGLGLIGAGSRFVRRRK